MGIIIPRPGVQIPPPLPKIPQSNNFRKQVALESGVFSCCGPLRQVRRDLPERAPSPCDIDATGRGRKTGLSRRRASLGIVRLTKPFGTARVEAAAPPVGCFAVRSSHKIDSVTCLRLSSRWIIAQSGSAWRRTPCFVLGHVAGLFAGDPRAMLPCPAHSGSFPHRRQNERRTG